MNLGGPLFGFSFIGLQAELIVAVLENTITNKTNMPKNSSKQTTANNPTGVLFINKTIEGLTSDWGKTREYVCNVLATDVRMSSRSAEELLSKQGYVRSGGDSKQFDVTKDGLRYEVRCVGQTATGTFRSLHFTPSAARGSGRVEKKGELTQRNRKTARELYEEAKETLGKDGGFIFVVFDQKQLLDNGTLNYYLIKVKDVEMYVEPLMAQSTLSLAHSKFVKLWNEKVTR